MFQDTDQSLRRHLPRASYIFFILVAGVMAGLVVWSLIMSQRTRVASEDLDTRGQLQTELRSLVGAAPLPPAGGVPTGAPVSKDRASISLTWIAFVLLIGAAITIWATINYYVASAVEADDEDSDESDAARISPPPTAIPEWMRLAIRSSLEGIMAVDASGRIMTANPAAEKLLGSESSRLPGQRILEFVPDMGQGPEGLRRFSQVAAPTEVTATRKDGSTAPLRLALSRVPVEGDSQYLAVFSAVEPVKAVAPPPVPVETAVAPPPLEAPVLAAAAAPKPALNEDALHDLENQIVMLGGYSELMVAALEPDHDARADAEAVARSAARAGLLCHEVAAVTQAYPRTIDLNAFAVAVTSRLATVLDEGCEVKGLRGEGPSEVWADPDLLERTLCSLAWRTQEWAGGLNRVTVAVTNGRLDLRMTPAGQAGSATRAAFDSLPAIDWIEKQNGTIEMEEHSEAGLRFRIWLPAAAQSRQPRPAAMPHGCSSKSHAAD